MNVAFDPWIPVVDRQGKPQLISLCAVFTDGKNYADLAVRPHERVSLMRLFLCVAHAALNGPKNYEEWLKVSSNLSKATEKYLNEWKDSFELFHYKRPWLQVAELQLVKDKTPASYLDFALATGNNPTIYDQAASADRNFLPSRSALNLLTFLCFSPGGGSPIARWKNVKTSQVGNPDAPCLSQAMLHSLFRADSLDKSIHLNLPTYKNIERVYKIFSTHKKKGDTYQDLNIGRPVWEDFPESPETASNAVVNATRSYLGRLVPISRWVLISSSAPNMLCCNGFKYETYRDGFAPEPTATVRLTTKKGKDERDLVKADPAKAPWRQLSSLLIERSANGLGGPLAMENKPSDSAFDFQICAITRNQASMDIAIEAVFHVAPVFQQNIQSYEMEVKQADMFANKLRWAVETYRTCIDSDWQARVKRTQAKDQYKLKSKLCETALNSFWTAVEKQLPLLMTYIEAIGTDNAQGKQDAWRKMLFKAACDSYALVCGQETPRQIRAFVQGWKKLTNTKNVKTTVQIETEEATEEHDFAN